MEKSLSIAQGIDLTKFSQLPMQKPNKSQQTFIDKFEKKLKHALFMSSAIEELYQQLHYEFQLNRQLFSNNNNLTNSCIDLQNPIICDQLFSLNNSIYEIDQFEFNGQVKLEAKIEPKNSFILEPNPLATKKVTRSKTPIMPTSTKTSKMPEQKKKAQQKVKTMNARQKNLKIIETQLNEWLKQEEKKSKALTLNNIQEKALSIQKGLGVHIFQASIFIRAWVRKFLTKYSYDKKKFKQPRKKFKK